MELGDDLGKMLGRSPKGKSAVKPKKAERRQRFMGRANATSVSRKENPRRLRSWKEEVDHIFVTHEKLYEGIPMCQKR